MEIYQVHFSLARVNSFLIDLRLINFYIEKLVSIILLMIISSFIFLELLLVLPIYFMKKYLAIK
jgi:hypothetical protein